MARDLDGSDDFLANTGGAPATAAPLTIACWFKADTLPGTSCLMSLQGSGSSHSFSMVVEDTPKKLKARINGGGVAVAIHGTTVTTSPRLQRRGRIEADSAMMGHCRSREVSTTPTSWPN